jgi:hypothetical protein
MTATFGLGLTIYRGFDSKLAFEAWKLAVSEYTVPLPYETALHIVLSARAERLDSFELWMTYEAYACSSLEEAVERMRELHDIYESPLSSE